MKAKYLILIIVVIALLAQLAVGKLGGEKTMTYKQISMDEAKQIFEYGGDDSYIILDVRR